MELSRLRTGEWIAGIGGIVLLFALLFLNWYGVGESVATPFGDVSIGAEFGAWDAQGFLGTLANLVILAAGIAAVGLAVVTAMERTVALPVAASALTASLGIGAVVLVFGRMLFQPGPNDLVDLEIGIFIALAGALAVAYGGWRSMGEEPSDLGQPDDRRGRNLGNGDQAGGPPGPRTGTGPEQGGGFPTSRDVPGGEAPISPPSTEGPPADGGA
jgi:hypothetical protein